MSRRRFHVPGELIHENVATLPGEQAHHLRHVLRLQEGDPIEIFDGEGAGYSGRVRYHGANVRVEDLVRMSSPESVQPPVILAQALIKADKFEWVLQKGTELGVSVFIPLESRFSDVRIPEGRITGRMERWQRIVREASRQSCRFSIPEIRLPMTLARLLSLDGLSGFKGLFLHQDASDRWNGEIPPASGYVLCIGPEGGWDSSEADEAAIAGFRLYNLGPRVLRAETAALAAVTLLQFQTAKTDKA
jgi:16S rRNA (uracil1498-N3)-methyltransferase